MDTLSAMAMAVARSYMDCGKFYKVDAVTGVQEPAKILMIKSLRAVTEHAFSETAGLKDCKDAIDAAVYELDAASKVREWCSGTPIIIVDSDDGMSRVYIAEPITRNPVWYIGYVSEGIDALKEKLRRMFAL